MRVVITGAAGRIGRVLTTGLRSAGHEVRVLTTAPQITEHLMRRDRDHRQRRRVDQARHHAERPAGHGVGDAAFRGGQRDVHGAVDPPWAS